MKRVSLLICALAGTFTMTAHAQMGWTLDQSRKHFGRESDVHNNTYYFRFSDTPESRGKSFQSG